MNPRIRYLLCVTLVPVSLVVVGCEDDAGRADADASGTVPVVVSEPDPHAGHDLSAPQASDDGHDPADDTGQGGHGAGAGKWIPTTPSPESDWCGGHGVPESLCTRCNSHLIAEFKESGDWCNGHGLPESQCLICNPDFRERWEALQPGSPSKVVSRESGPSGLEVTRRLVTGDNDPFCQVDQLQVRFRDKTIGQWAGIRTETVQARRVSATAECPGMIAFDETRRTHITPRVTGIISEVHAQMGDALEVGDVLAVIDSPSLGEAKSRYIELRENYLLAKSDFDRVHNICTSTQRVLETCENGSTAEDARKRLAGVRIGEAKGRLLKAHALLELARAGFEREVQMQERQISSEQEFERARSQLRAADAEFHATHEAIAFSMEREHQAAEKDLKVARSALDAADRRLSLLGVTDAQIEALAAGADDELTHYELRSPMSGHVVQRHAVPGESVDERTALFVLADLSSVWLMLDVAEREVLELRLGLPVQFVPDGIPGHSFDGKLDWISSQVDERTRTVKARVNLSNETGLLRANMFGTARIVLHDDDEVPTVPVDAVQSDGCCQLVFVKKTEDLFHVRKVNLGTSSNRYVEIHNGLELGEAVVTTGSFLMKTEILKSSLGAGCCEVDPGR